MKDRADKLFADKLSSLDSLPEGYSPNIDSKWAIIQGTTSSKKSVNYKIRFSIAACLLILFISTIVLKKLNTLSTVIVETPKPTQNILPSTSNENERNIDKSVNQIATQSPVQPKKRNSKLHQPEAIEPKIVTNNSEVNDIGLRTSDSGLRTLQAPTIEFADMQPAKDKRRYVEVDFSEPVQNNQTIASENTSTGVKFKLSLKKDNFSPDYSVSAKPLRIHQNF